MQKSAADRYKLFYGFRDMPFSKAVNHNPQFIYRSDNYEKSLTTLSSSLGNNTPVTLVLGEDGVGKSTFINDASKQDLQNSHIGLSNVLLKSAHELYRQTLSSFGHEVKYLGTKEMLQQLQDLLADEFNQHNGRPSILIIDDAQNMYLDALKGLESLLELNVNNKPLLQLVLVGLPALEDLLNVMDLDGLSESNRVTFWLQALSAEETQHYINHRLHLIGAVDKKLFDDQVCMAIYDYSKGFPGKINSICDEALLRSCAQQKHQISAALIHESANDAQHELPVDSGETLLKLRVAVTSDNKKVAWNYRSSLLAGLALTALIGVLIALWVSYFPTQLPLQNEVPNDVNEFPIKEEQDDQVAEPVHQLATRSKDPGENPGFTNDTFSIETAKSLETKQQLARAERHFNALRLKIPEGNNALDIYRRILDKDPSNLRASQGIKRIAKKYVELAESKYREGELNEARNYLDESIALDPELNSIQKMVGKIDKLQDQNQTSLNGSNEKTSLTQEEKVLKLLEKAERQFADLKIKFPEQDNAFKTYTSILVIDPSEERAINGLNRIVSYYLDKAEKLRREGDLDKSRLFINRGLRVSPNHQQLIALKQQVKAEKENVSVSNEIAALLTQADKQIIDSNLLKPPGNNAYQTYLDILAIDSNNELVIQKIEKLQKKLQLQIRSALDNQDFKSARLIAEQILSLSASDQKKSYLNEAVYDATEANKVVDNQMDRLLFLAEKQRKSQRFTLPAHDNAFETYNKVLQIDPANEVAVNGLSKLILDYQKLIKKVLSDGYIGQALTLANESLSTFPDSQDLKSLRDKALLQQKAAVKQENKSTKKKITDTEDNLLKTFGTF